MDRVVYGKDWLLLLQVCCVCWLVVLGPEELTTTVYTTPQVRLSYNYWLLLLDLCRAFRYYFR